MRKKLYTILILGILFPLTLSGQSPNLVWADEFEGTSLDDTKWTPQIGDGCSEGICGWGNNELQYYKAENATVSNGHLHITAKKERVQRYAYTSARIRTINKGDWTYGRFEALINLPEGGGLWPAFWMMPTDDVYGGWPKSGEIDIMEFIGWQPDKTLGYIHYGDDWPDNQHMGGTFTKHTGIFPGNWHEFAIEWEPGVIRWFVDGYLFQTLTEEDIAPYHWPFDQDFHFILNVAVGGNLGGEVDDNIFPQTMKVDYVRVYDGFKPYITGDRIVEFKADGVEYKIGNVSNNTNVNWTVPAGATIVSGQGTPNVVIDFDSASGDVIAEVSTSDGTETLNVDVLVEPLYILDFSFENFDDPALIEFTGSDGDLTVVNNPSPSTINSSEKSAKYVRDNEAQYDCIFYDVLQSIPDASEYSNRDRKFYMDVLTSAPVGTEIIIQLETPDATATNYPTGRHSRYFGTITKNGEWERIVFDFADRPDGSASHTNISDMVILFAPNTFTGDTYYWDNLDSYKADDGSGEEPDPDPVAVTGVSVSPTEATIEVNGTVQLEENVEPHDADNKDVTWSSDNTSVATVNSTGLVTGAGEGAAIITVTTVDGGYTATSSITVTYDEGGGEDQPMTNTLNLTTTSRGPNTSATAHIEVSSLGEAVASAAVDITWSGSYSGSDSGTTDGNGSVEFQTPNIRNASDFTVTVDNIAKSGYYWDAENSVTVASTSKSAALNLSEQALSEGEIDVYPNPAYNKLTIVQHKEISGIVEVYSKTGKLLLQEKCTGKSFDLDVSGLQSGIYFIRIITDETISSGRFIKD